MDKILPKTSLAAWLKKLNRYRLYAPVADGDAWNYREVVDPEAVSLDYGLTTLPPKKVLFPQKEVLLKFERTDDSLILEEVAPPEDTVVIFGPRPCEGKALFLLDLHFGGAYMDPYYWARRNRTVLVGLACTTPPSPNCFCLSVNGSPHNQEGLDVQLTSLADRYFVKTLTARGEALVTAAPELFRDPQEADKKDLERVHTESEKRLKRQLKNAAALPAKLKPQFDSPLWDEQSMSCLRCGICTYLCPTCHCFDISDEVEPGAWLQGQRVRTWDNCQFPDFTMHSSGHNPRPDKASRLRQRLFHKFQYFYENHQHFQCVGCGRCISLCPVGIDIIRVLEKVNAHGQ